MEDMLYWTIEYCKVLFGYGFLMFLWPMVVFRKYLKGKSVTFRFSFCVTVQVVLVNTVVLMLGLLHILNDWTVRILFYGTFLYSIREVYWLTPERKRKFKYLVNGTFGWKNFLLLERRKLVRIIEEFCKRIGRFYKKHWLEYSLLLVAVVYGVIYFSWGVFHDRSYGFSDIVVHHSWIYEIAQGNVFSDGIYPEGMHCMVYALDALFGIRIFSSLLFIAGVNMIVVLISLYCLAKELFYWRYSSVLLLVVVLTFGDIKSTIVLSLSRMQCALPQEFGFPAVFLCCLYLLRYLRYSKCAVRKEKETKYHWDENLLVFTLALADTIIIHFYTTFMAFFICVGVAIVLWKKIFNKYRFLPLIVAAVAGVFIAVLPMASGFMMGRPLQGSLYWGMEVIQGSSSSGEELENSESVNINGGTNISVGVPEQSQLKDNLDTTVPELSIVQKVFDLGNRIWEKLKDIGWKLYRDAYLLMFYEDLSQLVITISIIVVLWGSLYVIGIFGVNKICHKKIEKRDISGYLITVLASVIYFVMLAAGSLGLPTLMDGTRIGFFIFILTVMVVVIPFDFVCSLGRKIISEKVWSAFSIFAIGGTIVLIYLSGNFHGYLYFALTRFDCTTQVTERIIEELPEKTYTIISPTEELYQVIEYGWHEELLEFIEKQERDVYTLPTEYIFLFLEKRPLEYVQLHTFEGPEWLAGNKYKENIYYFAHSTGDEYITSEISEEAAKQSLPWHGRRSGYYSDLTSRTILESRLSIWCEKFKEMYPNEVKIYYEDEYFVCYYFRQNTQSLLNLSVE